ncbi:PREDICTED: chloroplastic group IIA intron splicing facilitator CRS1, chloroplastic [Fragaria vesca subsp. vesca]|uniref:chloroplastic group IIA intron splicing facilitator CRS1, chloroplastic n=1 Tax=Fragaria vesca subsp. vesca TaxID=101020 RepID=UPI0002C33190|nr:PREDICTED: chloroplastic group IIA intron splicing facilitator CRS1, chloroplastic [Fragaria vesca subsp. vesca]
MLHPLTHLPSSLPPKTLTDLHSFSPFFSFPKPPKPSQFTIRSSAADSKTLAANSAIQRIAEKLRSLGFTEDNNKPDSKPGPSSAGEIFVPLPETLPKYRVGHTIDPSWSTPEKPVPAPGTGRAISRFHEMRRELKRLEEVEEMERKKEGKKKEEKVPTLAEMSLSTAELRRLRTVGIELKKKVRVGKAGITEGIVNGIHENWRRSEVVKLVCEDLCRLNMKRTHDLLERKTGGLVVWRSGAKIILYRGVNYKYPYFLKGKKREDSTSDDSGDAVVNAGGTDEANSVTGPSPTDEKTQPALIQGVGLANRFRFQLPGEAELAEEADRMLEGLGPRFNDWWGYEPLPVDGDLLPAVVPGYRKPFRLLPYGLQPKLTDDEMTTIRRLARPLPTHFALGRNRKLQGLATSIVKLWEKCEIAKVAVKRGVQNTNCELMAEELKRLTGGTLIARDKEFIVLYRGKDFLPPAVSSAIEERRKAVMYADNRSRKLRISATTAQDHESRTELETKDDLTGGLPSEKRKLKSTEAAASRASIKLSMALEKREKAEKLLAELEKAESPQQPEIDKEGITEEERYMLRKVGLKMKPFLLMGRRGVFDGTIENMHLHWKYRELVKIICNEKSIESAHQVAQTLESESGGILVAVERVSKGYAIIVYRGKNYIRPANLRPQTLLTKREALKRSIEAQRRESLKLHVLKLNKNIDELEELVVKGKDSNNMHPVNESKELVREEVNNVESEECMHEENLKARGKQESHVTNMNLNDGMVAVVKGHLATQQGEGYGLSSSCDGEETDEVESRSSNGSVTIESQENLFNNVKGEVGILNKARDKQELDGIDADADLFDGMSPVINGQLATQQGKEITFSLAYDEDGPGKVESVSSDESVTSKTQVDLFEDIKEEAGVFINARDNQDSQVTQMDLNVGTGAVVNSQLATQQDKEIFSFICDENESGKVDPGSSVTIDSNATFFKDRNREVEGYVCREDVMSKGPSSSAILDNQHRVFDYELESSGRSGNTKSKSPVPTMVRKTLNEMPSRAVHLSNSERLLLRKQALKMKKRPVLAVGRNNIVTGVAKAIKAHFERYPLAIVNVKGRAKGTSVREIVFKLEQATGAVLVSQEPSKVILYRGWGAGDSPGNNDKKNTIGKKVAPVSPELLAAIRLECGLQNHEKEDATA